VSVRAAVEGLKVVVKIVNSVEQYRAKYGEDSI
jgi:hypothetical protein